MHTYGYTAAFHDMMRSLRVSVDGASVSNIVSKVVQATGINDWLRRNATDTQMHDRFTNVVKLVEFAQDIETRGTAGLCELLECFALASSRAQQDENGGENQNNGADLKGRVRVMTVHASKGLEFMVVFIVGMQEGTFPHVRSLNTSEALSEERRLAYVGFTRAKDILVRQWVAGLLCLPSH